MCFRSYGNPSVNILRQMKNSSIAVTLLVACLSIGSFARAGSANSLPQAVPRLTPLGTQNMAGRRAVPKRCGPGGCGGTRYSSYFSFNGTDGAGPSAGVIQVNGALYGTASDYNDGHTVVFSIPGLPSSEKVLTTLNGGPYNAGLTYLRGSFFGTTMFGGAYGYGEIFEVSPSGSVSDFYDFKGSSAGDGALPDATMIVVGGQTLCGTTYSGGTHNRGTVFCRFSRSIGSVLHSFGASGDGQAPRAPLTSVGGTLYGTTTAGGNSGWGTVFSINNNGQYSVLHSFSSAYTSPNGGLTYVNGELYGVSAATSGTSDGFVYKISTSGTASHVYDFRGSPADGASPTGSVVYVNGDIYGETMAGGLYGYNGGNSGDGTLYALTLSGSENVLWNFGNGTDGAFPAGGLIYGTVPGLTSNVLWGTTQSGGSSGGYGTVFNYCISLTCGE